MHELTPSSGDARPGIRGRLEQLQTGLIDAPGERLVLDDEHVSNVRVIEKLPGQAQSADMRPSLHVDHLGPICRDDAEELEHIGDQTDDETGARAVGHDNMGVAEICAGLSPRAAARLLDKRVDDGERAEQGRVPGGPQRLVNVARARDADDIPGARRLAAGGVADERLELGDDVGGMGVARRDDVPAVQVLVALIAALDELRHLTRVAARAENVRVVHSRQVLRAGGAGTSGGRPHGASLPSPLPIQRHMAALFRRSASGCSLSWGVFFFCC